MKTLAIALCAVGGLQSASAWTDMAFRGEENGWGTTALTLENGIWRGSIQAANTDANNLFKLYASDGGTWFGNGQAWTPPQAQTVATSGSDMSLNTTAGRYYTFTAIDASSLAMAVQETASAPVTIASFAGEVANGGFIDRAAQSGEASAMGNTINTITATLNTTPSAGENVYIAYSTDGFATKPTIVQASGAGTSWQADVGPHNAGQTVSYYVLTSTFSAANLNGVAGEIDQLLRALDETKATAQNYNIYNTGNSFHIQTQAAGSSGNTMLDGGNLSGGLAFDGTEATAFIYSGNVFQNATIARDQSALTLNYRINGGGWQTQAGSFDNTAVNDKYWVSALDLTGLSAGDVVEYYFTINYTDATTTYVFENGAGSRISGTESLAQSSAFEFQYGDAPEPPPGDPSAVPEPNALSLAMLAGLLLVSMRQTFKRRRLSRA
jgi:hypothetical protein